MSRSRSFLRQRPYRAFQRSSGYAVIASDDRKNTALSYANSVSPAGFQYILRLLHLSGNRSRVIRPACTCTTELAAKRELRPDIGVIEICRLGSQETSRGAYHLGADPITPAQAKDPCHVGILLVVREHNARRGGVCRVVLLLFEMT